MRAVIQRVSRSTVSVANEIVGRINAGLLILLGVAVEDTRKDADYLAQKIINLRVFEDSSGKLNLSLKDTGFAMLVVSQFTLMADCRKGRRPSFSRAAPPELARSLYEYFIDTVEQAGITTQSGRFRSRMAVALINDGPVTLIIDSRTENETNNSSV
jgi:D-tyrosyl-tRNA(Tyr) deacylase